MQNSNGLHLGQRRGLAWLFSAIFLFLVAAIAIAFIARFLFPGTYYTGPAPYYGGWFFFPFFFPFGFLFFFLIIFALGRLLFWPWGWRRGYWYHHDEAGDILRQRYARGELTKEQFDQMSRDLEQHR
jgi:putative membrane protein